MATARFESYVRETLADGVKERRAALKKAFDDEKAKIEAKLAALKEIADEGLEALNAKIPSDLIEIAIGCRDQLKERVVEKVEEAFA